MSTLTAPSQMAPGLSALRADAELSSAWAGLSAVRVHSVFASAVNLLAEDRLITLVSRGRLLAPDTIELDLADFTCLELEPGARFGTSRVDLSGVQTWTAPAAPAGVRTRSLSLLDQRLTELRAAQRRQPADPFEAAADARLQNAIQRLDLALISQDSHELCLAVRGLVGLGVGLTPSGDDVLAGLLVCAAERLPGLVAKIGDHWAGLRAGTTVVSAAMIDHALRGRGAEPLHELIVLADRPDEGEFIAAVDAVAAIGHHSGTDLLTGALLGLRAVATHLNHPTTGHGGSSVGHLKEGTR